MSHQHVQEQAGDGGGLRSLAMHATLATAVCSAVLIAAQFCQTVEAAADARRLAMSEWAIGSIDRATFVETFDHYCSRAVVVTADEWMTSLQESESTPQPLLTAQDCIQQLSEDPKRRGSLTPSEAQSLWTAIESARIDRPAPLRWL